MNIRELLSLDSIFLPSNVATREEAIQQMAEGMHSAGAVTDTAVFVQAVTAREQQSSTGIGFGVAIPHGKSAGVKRAALAFSRFEQPLEWESLDDQPAAMAFMIGVPEANAGNEHLQILVALSRKLIHDEFRAELLNAGSKQEVIDILSRHIG
ncbi:PTS sugar transporter subunit IIA [Paenibacillus bovis]|uniref:PTS fructose transporter subunit IIA n=1 Tax=Paenibacillus bovis TaxID=1616788 RepID=A0A172ZFP8_9BACL|nr:fructose PTS transporter subunit IIA [Paenibacillus bovis]ANF96333.1 PTS fructose transporter subunit IIA [Paenibacillus bovis]